MLFETTEGTVTFGPSLAPGSTTYFSIEDTATDINSNGGLQVSNIALAPEPAGFALAGMGLVVLILMRRQLAG